MRSPALSAAGRHGLVALLTMLTSAAALPVHGLQPGGATAEPGQAEGAAQTPPAAGLTLPELPADASPRELLEFIGSLMPPKQQPRSQAELIAYLGGVSQLAVEAADRVIAEAKEDEALFAEAARLKLQSLAMLVQLGDERAMAALKTFANGLTTSTIEPLADEANRMLIMAEAQGMLASGDFGNAGDVIAKASGMLKADPDDAQTVAMAAQFVQALERIPGGEATAAAAMKAFGPILETSSNERIRGVAKSFEAKLRFLELPGSPMEISGTLLDGQPFDPATLDGKVVLVDFWATWCGPCVAEIPNMLAEYEKYHDKGFEIVGISLDQNRKDVVDFVTDRKLPWPVLHEEDAGGRHPLAEFYGINGIPQFVLIGRDGNVITLDVRGEKLGRRLAELFKDAG